MDAILSFFGGVAASSLILGAAALWKSSERKPRRCARCKTVYYPSLSRAHYWEEYCSEACQMLDMADYD